MAHREVFSKNLKKYMALSGKSRREICEALGYSYFTFSDWVVGKKMPRMDKVEQLANYFGILKSDLIEEHTDRSVLKTISITEDEQKLLDLFRLIPENQQQLVLQMIHVALNTNK